MRRILVTVFLLAGSLLVGAVPATAATTLAVVAVTASASDANGPGNAVDGNAATRWSGEGDGVWIRFDLGAVTTVGSVALSAHYKLITGSLALNTVFEVRFVVGGGQIKAYYNGTLVSTISKSFSGAYFKAGAYTQANCTNSSPCSASNYAQVVIDGLTVSHT